MNSRRFVVPHSSVANVASRARRIVRGLAVLAVMALPAPALAQNGTVTGTVTNQATAAPATSGSVVLCSPTACTGFGLNASGVYTASLAPGTYVAYSAVASSQNLVNEIFDNISCPGSCNSNTARATGTPIVLASGTTVTRDFALTPGATISGVVGDTSSGALLSGVTVNVYTRVGTTTTFAGSGATNASGVYTVGGLAAGTYYAFTSGSTGAAHTNEIYGDILCTGGCNATLAVNSGAPIAVTAGGATTGIHFGLAPAARITGRIVNAQTLAPMQNVNVSAYQRLGNTIQFFAGGFTNANGDYTIGTLPTGNYSLFTSSSAAINEIYNNLPCPTGCSATDAVNLGQAVSVTQGTTTSGINFDLDPGGSIGGTITDAVTATAVQGFVQIYRQNGTNAQFVQSASASVNGIYSAGGLTTGNYFAVVSASPYVTEIFGGAQCVLSCSSAQILAGTPIPVTTGVATTGRNFAVDQGGTLSGTVVNATTGAPMAGVSLFMPTATNTSFGFSTNAAGVYTITGLPTGTYRLATSVSQFANQAYNNVLCPSGSCSNSFILASGTAITVTAGATTSNINFSLSPIVAVPGAPFNVSATTTATGIVVTWSAPTSGGAATSYILEGGLSPGTTVGTLPTSTTSVTLPLLPAGTYYLRIRGINAVGTGNASSEFTLVVGGSGGVTPQAPSAPFAWMAGGRLTFTWTAPTLGPTPTDYVMEVGTSGGLTNIGALPVGGRSFTFEPVPSGVYFLRVRARVGGVVSATSAEVMVVVGNAPAPPSAPQSFFHTVSGSTVNFTWVAPAIGVPTSYVFEAGTASGLSNLAVFNTGSTVPSFSVPGVPPGTYYLRIRAVNAQGSGLASNERVVVVQ